jgi:tetratricopeptide repeat protein 30
MVSSEVLQAYEELVKFHPEADSYKIYYAQSLYKAGLYPEANRACLRVDSEQYAQRLLMLQAAIKYEEDDLSSSKALLDRCVQVWYFDCFSCVVV